MGTLESIIQYTSFLFSMLLTKNIVKLAMSKTCIYTHLKFYTGCNMFRVCHLHSRTNNEGKGTCFCDCFYSPKHSSSSNYRLLHFVWDHVLRKVRFDFPLLLGPTNKSNGTIFFTSSNMACCNLCIIKVVLMVDSAKMMLL